MKNLLFFKAGNVMLELLRKEELQTISWSDG